MNVAGKEGDICYRLVDDEVEQLVALVDAFRTAQSRSDGVEIVWSSWTRTFDDGISNAMDRWYGPKGLRPEEPENAAYMFTGAPGMEVLSELAPTHGFKCAKLVEHSKLLRSGGDVDGADGTEARAKAIRAE